MIWEWEEWFENNSSTQSTDENELKNVIQDLDTNDEINIQSEQIHYFQ